MGKKELPEELIGFEKVVEAIETLAEAQIAYNQAYNDYEGYSWGWAGSREIDALEKAKKDLEDLFQKCVRQTVERVLKEKSLGED